MASRSSSQKRQREEVTVSDGGSDDEVVPTQAKPDDAREATKQVKTWEWLTGVIGGKDKAVCSLCNPKVKLAGDVAEHNLTAPCGRGFKGVFASNDLGARNRHDKGHRDEAVAAASAAASGEASKTRKLRQTTLDRRLDHSDVASLFAVCRLSFNAASHPLVKKMVKAATTLTVNRHVLQQWTRDTAIDLRERLLAHLKKDASLVSAVLAIDGGTINRQCFRGTRRCFSGKPLR